MYSKILFQNDAQQLQEYLQGKAIIVIADAKTNGFCVPVISKKIKAIQEAPCSSIPAGEANKTLQHVEWLWQQLQQQQVHKNHIAVIVGGGMLCDLAGFACANYMRGIETICIPTTLLAMNDAGYGGKTAINFNGIKNLIGQLHHPSYCYIDSVFLQTLSDRHIANGAAESIKHAIIHDAIFWNEIQNNSDVHYFAQATTIQKSLSIKQHYVLQDQHDAGIRQALNFGHSIGHAIESIALDKGFELLHGEAILLGMIAELKLSEQILNCPTDIRIALEALQQSLFTKVQFTYSKTELISKLQMDKKNKQNIKMSLLKQIAEIQIQQTVTEQDLDILFV